MTTLTLVREHRPSPFVLYSKLPFTEQLFLYEYTGDYDNKAGLPYGDKEHAFAIQDRMFKANGELFYPAFPGDPYYEGFIDDEGADLTNDTLFPYPTGRTEGNGGVSKAD
jgi:hypothetical protein